MYCISSPSADHDLYDHDKAEVRVDSRVPYCTIFSTIFFDHDFNFNFQFQTVLFAYMPLLQVIIKTCSSPTTGNIQKIEKGKLRQLTMVQRAQY